MNDDDSESGEGPPSAALTLTGENLAPEFRVVVRDGLRRGIRLEHAFWTALRQLAKTRKSTIGKVVEEVAAQADQASNLASALRVACLEWVADENDQLRQLASLKTVNGILGACPSPAFALSSSKRILTFNPPFLQLVRRQLPATHEEPSRPDLRLTLDLQVADILARFKANDSSPVVTGFVIGTSDKRYRGNLSVVRAPIREPELLLAFVFNG
ncbi:MAG: ribbon-helix-helix domain-containing protein [Alphaproteobacteria bacterium]|nr:ribbon-helix-helix domain-containing protein [Alphaproteobacteria bacterium]MBU0803524.1 ribbon-helix-helix domain-containing protein [Alphaproteobacteria bacterium]MBU0872061.1 ribbon-helix-helix domain-containing protein [Alphaproteobacteria bacterium]MBU1402452.1 ribbon-helix-helix domain-containing protein [Alphaproteobacteria bacterium]MBU1593093.1 ribbon-helix-helix domain-containing protein [Alphaproteobacteria bacterium]